MYDAVGLRRLDKPEHSQKLSVRMKDIGARNSTWKLVNHAMTCLRDRAWTREVEQLVSTQGRETATRVPLRWTESCITVD